MTKPDSQIFKFMSVDGKVFHLHCRTVGDALFDRSLLWFLTLCHTAYAATNLLVAELFKRKVEVFHWTSQLFGLAVISAIVLVYVAIVLTVFGLILSRLIKWGLIKTIYVPLLYVLPTGLYCLYTWSLGSDVITSSAATIITMFLIICACFDALYGRFVAPYHSRYVNVDQFTAFGKNTEEKTEPSPRVDQSPDLDSRASQSDTLASELPTAAEQSLDNRTEQRPSAPTAARGWVYIGKQALRRSLKFHESRISEPEF